jgi:hypothetical protein
MNTKQFILFSDNKGKTMHPLEGQKLIRGKIVQTGNPSLKNIKLLGCTHNRKITAAFRALNDDWKGVNWIHLAQDWKTVTLVNTVMNLQIP